MNVSGDFTHLFRNCGFISGRDPSFEGAVNLGRVAKDQGAVTKATIGLADLCGTILKQFLPKDPAIRVSEAWNTIPLPSTHINYAALDVYASWHIFKALSISSVGEIITKKTLGGTAVSLYSPDQSRIIAFGNISLDQPKKHAGVNVTKT